MTALARILQLSQSAEHAEQAAELALALHDEALHEALVGDIPLKRVASPRAFVRLRVAAEGLGPRAARARRLRRLELALSGSFDLTFLTELPRLDTLVVRGCGPVTGLGGLHVRELRLVDVEADVLPRSASLVTLVRSTLQDWSWPWDLEDLELIGVQLPPTAKLPRVDRLRVL